ncbi:unnamed protein product, partial [marine sediment metagenome]
DPNYADTDGDGEIDAYLYDTGVVNAAGHKFYAAVRVTDLAGLICVNTAGDPDAADLPAVTSPFSVNLLDFIGSSPYEDLHTDRCHGDPNDPNSYYLGAASRLLQPASSYLPFAIGDEMHLRWVDFGAATNAGRLYEATKNATDNPLPQLTRLSMTTFNCSRSLVRKPGAGMTERLRITTEDGPVGNLNQNRDDAYDRIMKLANIYGFPGSHAKLAAHFVANLWAYESEENFDDTSFKFDHDGQL